MSRRSQSSEVGFESDSFLDIIANIVGILIILIVIAGVRVSKEPLPLSILQNDPASNASEDAPVVMADYNKQLVNLKSQRAELLAIDRQRMQSLSEAEQLQQELEQVVEQSQKTEQQLSLQESRLQREQAQQLQLAEQLEKTKAEVEQLKGTLLAEQELRVQLDEQLEIGREIIIEQFEIRKKLQNQPAQKIKHKLTPVSRQNNGDEIHFYLRGNRLAEVPVKALLARAEKRLVQQRSWLMKYNKVQFTVGPIEGFALKFQAERRMASLVNQLRSIRPNAVVQMAFQIAPSGDLQSESMELATQPQGRFYQTLLTKDPHSTTLSIWVYPDSYETFRHLKAFAAEQNFAVAAWPREQDEPITGGTGGVNSSAQ